MIDELPIPAQATGNIYFVGAMDDDDRDNVERICDREAFGPLDPKAIIILTVEHAGSTGGVVSTCRRLCELPALLIDSQRHANASNFEVIKWHIQIGGALGAHVLMMLEDMQQEIQSIH